MNIKIDIERVGIVAGIAIGMLGFGTALWSNHIAHEALSVSQADFERQNRPYLSIRPVKFDDSAVYYVLARQGNNLFFKLRFQIRNNGQLPAMDIRGANAAQLSLVDDELRMVEMSTSSADTQTLTLTPGEDFKYEATLTLSNLTSEAIDDAFKKYADGTLTIPITIPVAYRGDLKDGPIYSSSGNFEVRPTRISIVDTTLN